MNILLTVFTLVLIAQAHITMKQRSKSMQHRDICIARTGVKSEVVEKSNLGEFSDDPLLSEFLFCMGKETGVINEAGEFQKDVMRAKIMVGHNAEEADRMLATCTSKSQATPQATSLQFAICIYDIDDCFWE